MMIQPRTSIDFYQRPPTSPQEPQNLLRPTNKGCGTCSALQLNGLRGVDGEPSAGRAILWLAMAASAGASAYHGYKRNNGSVGWGIGWFLLGSFFPVITPTVAVIQGYGKRRGR